MKYSEDVMWQATTECNAKYDNEFYYIDTHFNEKASLREKMRHLGVSSNHLSVVFKQLYNLSPSEYIKMKRIERTKSLLSETDLPITEIAYDIGFDSLSAFYSFFRKNIGGTPKQFRDNQKNL